MKITMYEFLGMIKDGISPKRIKFDYHYYIYDENSNTYYQEMSGGNILRFRVNDINDEVEILEEKKILEKLIPTSLKGIDNLDEKIEIAHIDTISVIETVNQIIDCINSKGDE